MLALIGVGLTLVTGNGVFDGAGLDGDRRAAGLRRDLPGDRDEALLLGESATREAQQKIVAADREHPGRPAADPHQDPAPRPRGGPGRRQGRRRADADAAAIAETIDTAEDAVREAEPSRVHIYLEPDLYRRATSRPRAPQSPKPPATDRGEGQRGVRSGWEDAGAAQPAEGSFAVDLGRVGGAQSRPVR